MVFTKEEMDPKINVDTRTFLIMGCICAHPGLHSDQIIDMVSDASDIVLKPGELRKILEMWLRFGQLTREYSRRNDQRSYAYTLTVEGLSVLRMQARHIGQMQSFFDEVQEHAVSRNKRPALVLIDGGRKD